MMNFFKKFFPVVIVLMTIVNLIASYGADNTAAFHANVIALSGWIILAMEELTKPKEQI
jgi:hypothetical protein